jgi:hypothetical protein
MSLAPGGSARAFRTLLLLGLGACAGRAAQPTVTTPPPAVDAGDISVDELRRDLTVFASDSFQGRETGMPGGFKAARFIADRLRQLGVEPAGDSGYFQRVPLFREAFGPGTRLTVTEGGRTTELQIGQPLLPMLNLGEGTPFPKHSAQGELAFVGYGIQESGRDDYAAVDVRGKVAVVLHGAPAGSSAARTKELEGQDALGMRIGQLIQRGAAGIIVLFTGGAEDLYRQFAPSLRESVGPARPNDPRSDVERPLPMIMLGLAQRGSPLLPANWPTDVRPQLLGGRTFSARLDVQRAPVASYNVVGIVRGSDPRLNRTYVAFGAHLDHIGIIQAVNGDSIANGADDDGSGSMGVLAIARSLQTAATKPRRSFLFVWHTGEEKGLLGSEHFVEHATVPIDSVVAQINADMIGRNGGATEQTPITAEAANTVFIVGPAAAPNNQSRALGRIVDSVNTAQPRPLRVDREWDTPTHPERIYFRSDHYNYAKKGIPIVFLTTGLHADYHKPSDEVSKIEFEKMARVARLMRDVGIAVANRASRPR